MEEENATPEAEPNTVCKCLIDSDSSEQIIISDRKRRVLGIVNKTENYLRERHIPELIRYLMTKVIIQESNKPIAYLEKLLDDCMLYRAGHGLAPVLYEHRHLEAVVKSFDPGQRGWLSAGQVRRAYTTLGLTPEDTLEEKIPTEKVLNGLRKTQEKELFELVSAGIEKVGHDFKTITKRPYLGQRADQADLGNI